jgi:hypothetical protein
MDVSDGRDGRSTRIADMACCSHPIQSVKQWGVINWFMLESHGYLYVINASTGCSFPCKSTAQLINSTDYSFCMQISSSINQSIPLTLYLSQSIRIFTAWLDLFVSYCTITLLFIQIYYSLGLVSLPNVSPYCSLSTIIFTFPRIKWPHIFSRCACKSARQMTGHQEHPVTLNHIDVHQSSMKVYRLNSRSLGDQY